MTRLRFAVATSRFGRPLRDIPRLAADTGAAGVQFDARTELRPDDLSETGRRQLLHALAERELSVASLRLPLRRPLYDLEHLDARIAALKQAMQFAWDLKARIVTCQIGRIPADSATSEHQRLQEVLEDLASYGNHVGITLSITPAGDSAEELRTLLGGITTGPLGIDFDPAACVLSRQHPGNTLRDLHSLVTHITIRDALGMREGGGREVPVGRGEVDWDLQVAQYDEMNYKGWLSVLRHEGDDPAGDAARAITYLTNVVGS